MSDDFKPIQNRDASVNGEQTGTGAHSERTEASAHRTPNCERMGPELKAYADGQSNLWQRFVVERQIARCPACRTEVEGMRHFKATLQKADAIAFTPALRARILAAVPESVPAHDATPANPARPQFRSPLPQPLILAGGVAGVIALAVLCYPLLTPSTSSRQDKGSMATSAPGQPGITPLFAPAPASSSSASAGQPVETDVTGMAPSPTTKRETKSKPQNPKTP